MPILCFYCKVVSSADFPLRLLALESSGFCSRHGKERFILDLLIAEIRKRGKK